MRAKTSLLTALLVTVTLSAAHAGNGVLLPQCEGDNCKTPNMGLGASPPSTAKDNNVAAPSPATEQSKAAKLFNSITNALPSLGLTPSSKTAPNPPASKTADTPQQPASLAPGGNIAPGVMTEQQKMSDLMKMMNMNPDALRPKFDDPRVQKIYEEDQRRKIKPPLVLSEIEMTSNRPQKKHPNSVVISVNSSYMWGADDVGKINKSLGYQPNQISANCQLRLDGKISTTDGLQTAKIYASQANTVSFSGALQAVSFIAHAVCSPPPNLPQTGTIITRIGKKYGVQLAQPINCSLPERVMKSIEVQYMGDGSAECKFN